MSNLTDQTSITDSRLDRELIFTNEDHYLQQRREEEERDKQRAVAQSQHNERIFAATPHEPDTPIQSVDVPLEVATQKTRELTLSDTKDEDKDCSSTAAATAEPPVAAAGGDSLETAGAPSPSLTEPEAVDKHVGQQLDKQQLVLRNLDTGEEFIIGENDPDFEFDTFELSYGEFSSDDEEAVSARKAAATTRQSEQKSQQKDLSKALQETGLVENAPCGRAGTSQDEAEAPQKKSKGGWWKRLLEFFSLKSNVSGAGGAKGAGDGGVRDRGASFAAARTPFSKLSSFRFRRELGRGAFGRVLLAEAKTDGSLYALKIISKKNMRQSDKKQAKTERDILLAMGSDSPHPFTTSLKFAFQSENNLYLGMPFIPGGTLRELIKRYGCLPEEWARVYSAELVLAISHMHSLKMLYRDIKPHNVMIDGRGHITIIDFGLSKQDISTAKGAMSLVGTPDYSAPEVLKTGVHQIEANKAKAREEKDSRRPGRKHKDDQKHQDAEKKREAEAASVGYGKAADWWSLGVMVYEMLSGTPAFRGTDLRHTYQRVLFSELIFTPEEKFSVEAKTLLNGLLCRDPAQRLGAEENPPRDIMNAAFFAPISWEKVYARTGKGPWVPEVPRSERRRIEREHRKNDHEGRESGDQQDKKKKRSSKKTEGGKTEGEGAAGATTPASERTERSISTDTATPIVATDANSPARKSAGEQEKGYTYTTVNDRALDVIGEGDGSGHHGSRGENSPAAGSPSKSGLYDCVSAHSHSQGQGNSPEGGGQNSDSDRGREDSVDCSSPSSRTSSRSEESSNSQSSRSVDSVEGEIHLRDSIFQHSKAANQQNRLQDWSFFDEKMLLSASQSNQPAPDTDGNVPPSPAKSSSGKDRADLPPRTPSNDATASNNPTYTQNAVSSPSKSSKSKSKSRDKGKSPSNGAKGEKATTLTSAK